MGIQTKLMAMVLAVVLAIAGYQYWQMSVLKKQAGILIANNSVLDAAVKTQHETIDAMQGSIKDIIKNSAALAEAQKAIRQQSQKTLNQLNSYRGRLSNAALKKPTLVERRANDAFTGVLQQFTNATGHTNPAD